MTCTELKDAENNTVMFQKINCEFQLKTLILNYPHIKVIPPSSKI